MLERTRFATRPERIDYHTPPTKTFAEAWLRINIEEVSELTSDGTMETHWEADEAYFETSASVEDIEDDFEGYFEEAAGWTPEKEIPVDIQQLRADVDYLLMKEGE